MTRLSVGIVGAGEITRKLHLPVLLSMPDVEVAWICDRRQSQAELIGRAYGIQSAQGAQADLLPSCDVTLLAIPIEARTEYLEFFAAKNTAVLCEKPFAASVAQHRGLIAAFPAHRLGGGYQRRFYQSTGLLSQILSAGWFGPLRRISLHEGDRSRGSGVDHSFLDDAHGGFTRGALFDLGTHGIDLVLHLIAAEEFDVISSLVTFDGAIDRRVTASIRLRGTNTGGTEPVILDFGVSWLDRQSNIIQLHFDHATVWAALSPSADVFLGDPNRPSECIRLSGVPGATTPNQAFYLEWREFLRGVRAQSASTLSAQTSLLTTELLEQLLIRGRRADSKETGT